MSYLRKAKDLRDRIQGKQQSNAIRTGIRTFRNAARRPGGGGGKTKPGIDLHYKNLQPDREFEAVLDDIDASPDPVFSSSIKEPSHEPEANVPRSRQSVTTESKSHSAPETDTIPPDDEEDGQGKIRGDPLLGVVVTDSEEDSEDLELDAETVNVLESLHLTEKGPGGLVDSAGSKYGSVGPGKEGGEGSLGEKGGEDEKPRLTVNNESVHNNTHILDEEEVGDTLVINSDAHSSKQCDRETSTQTTTALDDKQPTLDELLEHGSAALPTRGYSSSPHRASPLGTPPLLQDSSPSPLASSHETDTTEIFYSITRAYTTPPGHNTRPSTTVPELQHDDNDHKHSEEGHEKTVGQDGAKFTDTSASAHGSSAVDVPVRDKGLLNLRTGDGENKLGLSPASDHPLDLSDEDVVGVAVTENPTCAKTHCVAADGEDELFPDDAKLLQDSAVTSAKGGSDGVKSRSNRLDIREDYFASSPDEQRSKRTAPSHRPPRPSPPSRGKSPSKQNSNGKVAPPRPPRSPQLASRLKLRQEEKAVKNHSSTQPSQYRPFTSTSHKPVVSDRVTVKIVQPLGSAPTGRTNASSTEVEPSTVHGSASLASEVISPVESVTSSVDSAFLHSVTSPLTPVLHKAATTPQQSLDETAPVDINTPPFLPLHIHLLIAGVLYFYYTFNPFVYLAGLMAGFLAFFLSLGAVFVAYVQKEEEEQAATSATTEHSATELSDDFMKSMGIRLEEYETRFIVSLCLYMYMYIQRCHSRIAVMGHAGMYFILASHLHVCVHVLVPCTYKCTHCNCVLVLYTTIIYKRCLSSCLPQTSMSTRCLSLSLVVYSFHHIQHCLLQPLLQTSPPSLPPFSPSPLPSLSPSLPPSLPPFSPSPPSLPSLPPPLSLSPSLPPSLPLPLSSSLPSLPPSLRRLPLGNTSTGSQPRCSMTLPHTIVRIVCLVN